MRIALMAVASLLLVACQDPSGPSPADRSIRRVASAATAGAARPGHHIVLLRSDVADVAALARSLVAAHAGVLEQTYRYAVKGFAAEFPDAALVALRNHPDVVLIEPDGYVRTVVTQTNATWGLDRVDQRDLPLNATYSYETMGGGVHVYIIDTGIRTTHVEFGGRATSVFDVIGDGNGAGDCNGHGTHVAGTAAGTTYGVAKAALLHSVRVLDCTGSGTISGVIAGVDWVTANRQVPAVANMSLGGPASAALDAAVANSITTGVSYVVAGGNDGLVACGASPARVPSAITVGSTTSTDQRSSFSNFGTCLDLFAPGSGITSAYGGSDTQIAVLSGTSMASPHVAGAVARYLGATADATPAQITSALVANATAGRVGNLGTGSPNRLLSTGFMDAAPPTNQPPVAQFAVACTNLSCSFNSSASTDDVAIVSRSWTFGDGASAGNLVTATRTYAAAGTYQVIVTVTDGGGLSATATQAVTVTAPAANQPPVPRFTVSCTDLSCTFDSSTSTDDVAITARQWHFGDNTVLNNVVVAVKTYAVAGTYTVRLWVGDAGSLYRFTEQSVAVTAAPPPANLPPVAQFTVSCTNLSCSFNSSGSTDDVGIVSRSWAFGDGAAAGNLVSATRTYAAAGTYQVTLTVTDGGGLSATSTQSVTVTAPPPANLPPVAQFTVSCTNLSCSFNSSGSTDDVGIVSRSWAFGDGAAAGNLVSATRTYAAAGTYQVTLTVTDGGGLSATSTQAVTVTLPAGNQAPVPRFTVSCVGRSCSFDSSTSTDDVGITARQWHFGDGSVLNNVVAPVKTYASGGTYTVRFWVGDGGGLYRFTDQQVTVP